MEPVSQESEPFESFTEEERTIPMSDNRLDPLVIRNPGDEAPWLGIFGACFVKVWGMRRRDDGVVEFGLGNEEPPIIAWVTVDSFFDEWPDE